MIHHIEELSYAEVSDIYKTGVTDYIMSSSYISEYDGIRAPRNLAVVRGSDKDDRLLLLPTNDYVGAIAKDGFTLFNKNGMYRYTYRNLVLDGNVSVASILLDTGAQDITHLLNPFREQALAASLDHVSRTQLRLPITNITVNRSRLMTYLINGECMLHLDYLLWRPLGNGRYTSRLHHESVRGTLVANVYNVFVRDMENTRSIQYEVL